MYLINSLSILLDGCLRKDSHDFGDASVADPDFGAIEDEVLAVGRQHGARPVGRSHLTTSFLCYGVIAIKNIIVTSSYLSNIHASIDYKAR